MNKTVIPLSLLKKGDKAIIVSLDNSALGIKLMEMGCMPGEHLAIDYIAPLGDPISIRIGNYLLGLRKDEAVAIKVMKQ
ncbi:iron transporter FeoA [Bacteroidota bacterium]|nr:iron transporter FeoA [Bacteroidota bacterium]